MNVETLKRISKPRERKLSASVRRSSFREVLLVSDQAEDLEKFGCEKADLFTQASFLELAKKPACRVLILCDPEESTLAKYSELWSTGGPLALLVSDHLKAPAEFLRFTREEASKAPFATMVRGLTRDKDEKHAHELLARITHDMRNPMSVIKMACQFIKRKSEEKETLRYVDMIQESSTGIQTLIGDILDYSKLNQGSIELHASPFDLRALVTSVVDSTRVLVKGKEVEIRADLCPGLPRTVSGDPGRLRQILVNLMGNAVKFTEQGHVVIRVHHRNDKCYFDVEDTGIGIAEKSLKKIFQPYEQADSTIVSRFGGTGLGLNICKSLTERMGGRITVRSRLGEGSVFSFYIDLPEVERASRELAEINWDTLQIWCLGKDCPAVWKDRCEKLGVQLSMFKTSFEMNERAVLGNPDLLLFRLEEGGFDELERTLKHFTKRTPRIIVTTSCGQRGDGERCKNLGVSGYLTAPYELEDLESVVKLILHAEPGDLVTKHTLKERSKVSR